MSTRSATFTTTHWVIDRVHNDTANTWATTEPARATSLTRLLKGVIGVADYTNGSFACGEDETSLARRHLDNCVVAITSGELSKSAGTASDNTTLSRAKFDVVDDSAERNNGERESVSYLGSYLGTRSYGLTDLETVGSEDVALFAILIDEQSDASGTIRIVLD